MKRLSELPERNPQDQTQQLSGENPVKLLLSNPTGDVLAAPSELLPAVPGTNGIIDSNDTWARLEQIKEAYEKGPEATSLSNYKKLCPHYYIKGATRSDDVIFQYAPNNTIRFIAHNNSDIGVPRGTYIKEITIVRNSTYYSSDNNRWIFGLAGKTTNFICPDSGNINNYTHRIYDFFYNPKLMSNDTVVNISFPNATTLRNNVIDDAYANISYKGICNIIAPNVTTAAVIYNGYGGTIMNRCYAYNIRAYFPKLNSSTYIGISQNVDRARAIPLSFDTIKYFLDNLNKTPTNGHRNYPYVVLSNMRAPSSFTSGESITINYTDANGAEQTAVISDVVVETGERMVDAIKRKVKSTDSLKDVLDVFSVSVSKFYISGPKGSIINSVESTANLITVPSGAITPKETTAGQPLLINCGVDEALGSYVDPTDKSKGWIPTGTFGDYIGQFLLDCAGKWNIVWYPAAHA